MSAFVALALHLIVLPPVAARDVGVEVVNAAGAPVAGAEITTVTGPFPGVGPLVSTVRRTFVSDAGGRARVPVRRGRYVSAWAARRDGGVLHASRVAEALQPGVTTRLVLRPFRPDTVRVTGLGPWRTRLGSALAIRVLVRGRLATWSSATLEPDGVVRLPLLPRGPFVLALCDGGRPVDWLDIENDDIVSLAPPLSVALRAIRRPAQRLFLDCGVRMARAIFEIPPGCESLAVGARERCVEDWPRLLVHDPIEPKPPARLRIRKSGVDLLSVQRMPRWFEARLVDERGLPVADRDVWTQLGTGLIAVRTDARGRFYCTGRWPAVLLVERGRGSAVFPSRRFLDGPSIDLDLRRRVPVELRVVRRDGTPIAGATCDLGFVVLGPADPDGRIRTRLMPGRYYVPAGPTSGPTRTRRLNVRTGAGPVRLEVVRWDLLAIEGVVELAAGQPAPGATVRLLGEGSTKPISYGRTRADGSFRFLVPSYARPRELVAVLGALRANATWSGQGFVGLLLTEPASGK